MRKRFRKLELSPVMRKLPTTWSAYILASRATPCYARKQFAVVFVDENSPAVKGPPCIVPVIIEMSPDNYTLALGCVLRSSLRSSPNHLYAAF